MKLEKRMTMFLMVCALWTMVANFAHPITPTFMKSLSLPDFMFGVALSSLNAGNFLFSPFWGKANGYLSSKVTLFIGCCGYGVSQVWFMLSTTSASIAAARFSAGVFCGGIMVSMLTYIVNTSPEGLRGRTLTLLATFQGVCNAFGFFIGGFLGELSVRGTFLIQSVALCICGILYLVVCENDAQHEMKGISIKTLASDVNPFSAFLSSRHFLTAVLAILFLVATFQTMGYAAYDQSFNYYIKDQFGFSPSYNGILKGGTGVISLVANFTICMWILKKTNIRKSLMVTLALSTASLVGVILVGHVVPFILINVVYFALTSITNPLIQNLVAEKAQGKDSNLIMGFYNAVKSLGGIAGPLTAGLLYTIWPKNAFIFSAAAFLAAAAFSAIYYRMGQKEQANLLAED